ncbi:MAG: hypothetical protein A2491_17030 [Bacteroidetes bacterium RIFOXYC12_FULL_35_7]|nr:MAG: hypothetical protein A2491_17030 [Bacteroidetes bacterium RIFOXYC12_FULL_35_7]
MDFSERTLIFKYQSFIVLLRSIINPKLKFKMKKLLFISALALLFYSCSNQNEKLSDPNIDAKVVMQLGHFWGISDLCYFPDGKKIVSSGWDASVRVWDVELSRELMVFKGKTPEEGFGNIVKVDVSPDGNFIAAASERGKVYLLNATEGTIQKTIDVANNRISALSFSPDGKTLACGGYNKTISIIEVATGQIKSKLEGHTGIINDLDFDKEGKFIASSGNDSSCVVWDITTQKQVKKIKFKFNTNGVQFSCDGSMLAVNVNWDKKIYVYDTKVYTEKAVLEGYCTHFTFEQAHNDLIAINGSKTVVWNVKDKKIVKEIQNGGSNIKISPDGSTLASSDMAGIELFNIETGKKIKNFAMNVRTPSKVHVSRTGKFLITENSHISSVGGPDLLSYPIDTNNKFKSYHTSGSGSNILTFEGDKDMMFAEKSWGDLNFYDLTTGATVRGIKDKLTTPVCITPDGKTLVAKDKQTSDSYAIFDISNGDKKQELVNTKAYHYFSGISPDGKYYAMLTMDFFKVWELPSGKEAKAYEGRNDFDNVLFFSMLEEKYVVGMYLSGYFVVKDVMTGAEILRTETKTSIRDAALSPDKKSIALACDDWTVKIVDVATKAINKTIKGHEGSVTSVAFSKKGEYVFSASQDKTIKVWETATGLELLTILGLEKMGEYEGESKDFVIVAPNGRIDGTKEGINYVLYMQKEKEIVPATEYWDKIYTPNLLGRTLGQDF